MSKPHEIWWGYARQMVKVYPLRKAELDAMHEQKITPSYGRTPGGGGEGRTVEALALRSLPPTQQREFDAVDRAIRETRALPHGDEVMRMIDLVHWKRSHTIVGVALMMGRSDSELKRWHRDFIMRVGKNYFEVEPQSQSNVI